MEVKIILEYDDITIAKSVVDAVSPDNLKTPKGLSIKTLRRAEKILTRIRSKGKLPTLIATVDDLLFCVSTAEKAVLAIMKTKCERL